VIVAGKSDKYGQVYVERVGNTGFDDPNEPIGLIRAQDEYALQLMKLYLNMLQQDPEVPALQMSSVEKQINAMEIWRAQNPYKIRVPGTTQGEHS
jgi:hypothetical protein